VRIRWAASPASIVRSILLLERFRFGWHCAVYDGAPLGFTPS
jgi:hypothetical protein